MSKGRKTPLIALASLPPHSRRPHPYLALLPSLRPSRPLPLTTPKCRTESFTCHLHSQLAWVRTRSPCLIARGPSRMDRVPRPARVVRRSKTRVCHSRTVGWMGIVLGDDQGLPEAEATRSSPRDGGSSLQFAKPLRDMRETLSSVTLTSCRHTTSSRCAAFHSRNIFPQSAIQSALSS